TILRFDSVGSTNDEALCQARAGASEGLCIVAKKQTQGRGRHGRTWVSEKDSGLYFSVILRPKIEARYISLLTLMAGVAVHDTIRELGIDPDIKWVNDILVRDKKIAGILAEAAETPSGVAVVVGIGINVKVQFLSKDIASASTSLDAESADRIVISDVENALVRLLGEFYGMFCEKDGPARILDEWRQRSSYFAGKNVRVTLENDVFTGVTDGLEPNGALRVVTEDGELRIVHAGDVQRLRAE
ncbi:MAG TPA: biotin--[acetyl-CoA-carboxylase] ligase, partial [Pyrinomonadaceae bacterium]|nr:biotin--[acetyl-CoA-carboxylase] ligase [Pyrinomonadaceae bacterium]